MAICFPNSQLFGVPQMLVYSCLVSLQNVLWDDFHLPLYGRGTATRR